MNAFSYIAGLVILVLIVGAGYLFTTKKGEAPTDTTQQEQATGNTSAGGNDTPTNTSGSTQTNPGAGGSTGAGGGTTAPTPKTVTVNYSSGGYSPATVEINVGDTVKWVSDGTSMWTASANHPSHTIYPEFDQKSVGTTYQFTFTKVGTWGYHNHRSASHIGTVIVK